MKNFLKIFAIGTFVLIALGVFVNRTISGLDTTVSAQAEVTPTPPAEQPAANTPQALANVEPAAEKTIPKDFVLSTDSLSEYGAAPFDHETHGFQKYSPDGKSVVGCVECHHTDQPKSSLKPPLLTSERDETMTFESWKKSDQKVSRCRTCHFQEGDVPEGKEMPKAIYVEAEKEVTKNLNNEIAYHINCNTCHDAAFKLRPDLKQKKGFSTSKDCLICHEEQ